MRPAIPAEEFDHGDPRRFRRGCRCDDCRAGERRRRRTSNYLCATGRRTNREPQAASRHVHALRRAGMNDGQILAAAGICPDVLYRLLRGGRISASNERKILAVPVAAPARVDRPGRYLVDGTGTRRRLRALTVAGWTSTAIGDRLGVTREFVNELTNREQGGVHARTAGRVREMYLQIWDQRPEDHGVLPWVAQRLRRSAAARGWHPAAAWDDIDDPQDQPQLGDTQLRREAIVEDTAELAAQGLPREAIAARIGVAWNTVQQAHIRCGVPVPAVAS
jgi:hypothetical protein